jgi:tetratricopeptide (TPR) repeat protein
LLTHQAMRISLCLIAKNEAAFLPACLASVKGAVDEIIVVDTGSGDHTIAIAKKAGARVLSIPWADDFAAARNESVAHATGDYVLVLDADEQLAPGAAAALRLAAEARIDCGVLRLHNALIATARPKDIVSGKLRSGLPRPVLRFFRRAHPRPFHGRIHEGIDRWAQAAGMTITPIPADLVHYGNTAEMRRARKKTDRNLRLLELRAKEESNDPVVWGYLAAEQLEAGKNAWPAIEAGWTALLQADPRPSGERLAALRTKVQLDRGDAAGALETLRQIREWEGSRPLFSYLAGAALESSALSAPERTALLEKAAAEYRACLDAPEALAHTDVPGMSTWQGRLRLGTVLVRLGRPLEAAPELMAANESAPPEALLEIRLAFAEACLEAGDLDTAVTALEGTLGEAPDGWILAAAVSRAAGNGHDASVMLAEAERRRKVRLVAPHRRTRWTELRA